MTGAVMGGGLEFGAACHVRVAEETVRFQMPEGQRGIFIGGGGSVRISRLIGADRLTEMMLTGRIYSGIEGERLGLAHYVVPEGQALAKATELAERIARNSRNHQRHGHRRRSHRSPPCRPKPGSMRRASRQP